MNNMAALRSIRVIIIITFKICSADDSVLKIHHILTNPDVPCDLNLFHDGLRRHNSLLVSSPQVPKRIVFCPKFEVNHNFWTLHSSTVSHPSLSVNIFQTKSLTTCRINIVLVNRFVVDENQGRFYKSLDLRQWFKLSVQNQYHFRPDNNSWITSTANVYFLLYTNYEKIKFGWILQSPIIFHIRVDNFAIIFLSKNYDLSEICVLNQGKAPILENMICAKMRNSHPTNVLKIFLELRNPPKTWYLGVTEGTDIPDLWNTSTSSPLDNPFKSNSTASLYLYLLQIIFQTRRSNATLSNGWLSYRGQSSYLYHQKYDYYPPNGVIATTKWTGHQFLSCYSQKYISFQFYLTPFQPEVWGMLIFSGILVVSFISCVQKCGGSFSSWVLILATIFEESIPVPPKMEKQTHFRLIMATWTLMSLILVNCYNGLMITELNSPFKGASPHTFSDLVCANDINFVRVNKFWDDAFNYYILGENTSLNLDNSKNCFQLLSPIFQQKNGRHAKVMYEFFNFLLQEYIEVRSYFYNNVNATIFPWTEGSTPPLRISLFSPDHPHRPQSVVTGHENASYVNAMIEKDIVDCDKKSVFVSSVDTIRDEVEYLKRNYFHLKFHVSRDVLNETQMGWMLSGEGSSKIPVYFKFVVESGIHGRLMEEVSRRKLRKRIKTTGMKSRNELVGSVGLKGGIVTIFMLSGAVGVIGFAVFCGERFWIIISLRIRCYRIVNCLYQGGTDK